MDRYAGIPPAKAGEDIGNDGIHRRGRGKVEQAAVHAAQLRQIGLQIVEFGGDGLAGVPHLASGLGEEDLFPQLFGER